MIKPLTNFGRNVGFSYVNTSGRLTRMMNWQFSSELFQSEFWHTEKYCYSMTQSSYYRKKLHTSIALFCNYVAVAFCIFGTKTSARFMASYFQGFCLN